jgi:hypothetical protein
VFSANQKQSSLKSGIIGNHAHLVPAVKAAPVPGNRFRTASFTSQKVALGEVDPCVATASQVSFLDRRFISGVGQIYWRGRIDPSFARARDVPPECCNNPIYPSISSRDPGGRRSETGTKYAYTGKP